MIIEPEQVTRETDGKLRNEILALIQKIYCAKYIGTLEVFRIIPLGVIVRFGLNCNEKPIYIAAELPDDKFLKYMEKEMLAGYEKAIKDCRSKKPNFTFDIQTVNIVKETKNTIDEIFKEISKRIKKCETREEKESVFNSLEYRLRFLTEYTVSKAYWYAYVKTCNALGKEKVYVDFGNSEDKKHHKSIIDTNHFSLDDIPPFHAYCSCKIKTEKGGE